MNIGRHLDFHDVGGLSALDSPMCPVEDCSDRQVQDAQYPLAGEINR